MVLWTAELSFKRDASMIVSLIRTSPLEERWRDGEHEFAFYLAHKMAAGPKGTMHDIDASAQTSAIELLNSQTTNEVSDHTPKRAKRLRPINDEALTKSRIVDICNSDILVFDVPVHSEEDLDYVAIWAKAVCHLNSALTKSNNCSCAILNDKKKVYVMVTLGVTDETAERARARKSIRQALAQIKIKNPVVFFRCFEDEASANTNGAIDGISTIQSNDRIASQMKTAVFH